VRHPAFLTLDEVLALHEMQLGLFGGAGGIRDLGLLDSAVANAEATFGGEFLHGSLYEMAAAYLYGICRNHPFVDGNKRTAAAAAMTFLDLNRVEIDTTEDDLYDLVIGVAEGRVSKAAVAVFFEQHTA
jgi:death-on-curing protein